MKNAESRRRKTAKIGKFDKGLGYVPPKNANGTKGRSQRGCFGNHVNSLAEKEG